MMMLIAMRYSVNYDHFDTIVVSDYILHKDLLTISCKFVLVTLAYWSC